MTEKEIITTKFQQLQNSICGSLEACDGKSAFREDKWNRDGGGGGISRIIENGDLIEKGGVNFSAVWGATPDHIKKSFDYQADQFYATGVSIVLHPQNPYVPVIHMNIRYFELNENDWWFGGGVDLTPHYIDEGEAKFFHLELQKVCEHYEGGSYDKFKKWADDYFYIAHRNETRGVGGIFFDRLTGAGRKEKLFDFVMGVGNLFIPIYTSIIQNKRSRTFSEAQRSWQRLRRGRYVEFNLVLDRGTKFGLETNGRTESILMSLPPMASWVYNHVPEEGSPEWHTLQSLKKNIDWINA